MYINISISNIGRSNPLRHQRNNGNIAKLEDVRKEIDNLISKSKKEYYQVAKLLNNETFSDRKKVPTIPPLFFNDTFVTDFQEKANIFKSFFFLFFLFLQSNVH